MNPRPRILPAVLALAILGISISGPLARLSAAPPLAIAVWRLTLSLGIVAVPLLWTGSWRELTRLGRREVAIALAAGSLLALHFWSWIASLAMTSVAASVLLVNLHPVVMVLGGALWLGERPTRAQVAGLALAMLGAAIVALGDAAIGDVAIGDVAIGDVALGDVAVGDVAIGDAPRSELPSAAASASATAATAAATAAAAVNAATPTPFYGRAMLGNLLALAGAATVGLYYLAGRRLRQQLTLWPYVALVYGACWLVLLVLAAWRRTPLWPQPPRELGIFALIALGPMLAGHTGFNWALRYVPAAVVSAALLAEPVGAGVIAWIAFAEVPTRAVALGGVVVLGGLVVAARGTRSEERTSRSEG